MREQDRDIAAARRDPAGKAGVILEIPGSKRDVGVRREKREHLLRGYVEGVQHHVQPAAMRHAQDDSFDAVSGGAFDRLAQQRDDALASLEAELLVGGVARPVKPLECLRRHQLAEDAQPVVAAQIGPARACLHPGVQPAPLLAGADVCAIDRDRPAVGLAQAAQQCRQRENVGATAKIQRVGDRFVDGQAIGSRVEFDDQRRFARLVVQRIDRRAAVPVGAIGFDKRTDIRGQRSACRDGDRGPRSLSEGRFGRRCRRKLAHGR